MEGSFHLVLVKWWVSSFLPFPFLTSDVRLLQSCKGEKKGKCSFPSWGEAIIFLFCMSVSPSPFQQSKADNTHHRVLPSEKKRKAQDCRWRWWEWFSWFCGTTPLLRFLCIHNKTKGRAGGRKERRKKGRGGGEVYWILCTHVHAWSVGSNKVRREKAKKGKTRGGSEWTKKQTIRTEETEQSRGGQTMAIIHVVLRTRYHSKISLTLFLSLFPSLSFFLSF